MEVVSKSTSGLVLSEADIELLLNDKTGGNCATVATKIASTYTANKLSEKEQKIAEQIFRLLVRTAEIKVRTTLAENLKLSTNIPKDIVFSMARDVFEVSLPVLEYSEVLSDYDLLDIIRSTEENERFAAISRRKHVSEAISSRLIEKGNDWVVGTLINNKGAEISDKSFSEIIERHKENSELIEAITTRPQLPINIVEKLVTLVSDNISKTLRTKYKIHDAAGEHIKKEVDKTRESETLNLVRAARSHADVDKLIGQLKESDRLTPSMILSALCQGNFDFFESSLANLAGIPVENARVLIADRGDLGFRAIYNKSGLPDAMFPAVKMLLKVVRELDSEGADNISGSYSNRIVERILERSEESPVENLSYIIALVRRVAQ